eukprot:7584623-Alexandrium_andersonii.AAC.1
MPFPALSPAAPPWAPAPRPGSARPRLAASRPAPAAHPCKAKTTTLTARPNGANQTSQIRSSKPSLTRAAATYVASLRRSNANT